MVQKVITIAQQKGGAGKTTVSAHLAVALSQKGKRVALVDIDPQQSLTTWHALREERFGEGYTGITFCTAMGWRVNSEVTRLKRDHDFVIIDSPPHTETEAKTAIRAADLILIPLQPSPTDLWATQATVDLALKEQKLVRILLNRLTPNSKLAATITDGLDHVLTHAFGNRVAFASSLLEGRCVTETAPSTVAAKEVKLVTEEILDLVSDKESAKEKEVELEDA